MRVSAEAQIGTDVPLVEVEACDAGPLAIDGLVEIDTPRDEYRYELTYDKHGRISEARSWKYDAETDERTFTRFDADGNQLSRFVTCKSLGTERMYGSGDKLV